MSTPEVNGSNGFPPLPPTISNSVIDAPAAVAEVENMLMRQVPMGAQPQTDILHLPGFDPDVLIPRFRALSHGCYLLHFQPTASSFFSYYGTMRVERNGFNTTASGDLYQHNNFTFIFRPFPNFGIIRVPNPGPNPANGIPILSRSQYRYYVRVTQILEFITLSNSFTLGYELHKYDAATATWSLESTNSAVMQWTTAPAGYPLSSQYLEGDVKDASGAVVGKLSMGWISKYFRKATIEIAKVSASETPLNSGSGIDWQDIFDAVSWEVDVKLSDTSLSEPSGISWSDAEMHASMLANRDAISLDKEWRYYLICVRRLDSTTRGIMFDAFATDSNNVPREGAGISSHWVIPNENPWGLVKGQRFGTATAPYFRTAVHELGHAMGLYHNTADNGFMNTTETIANTGTAATPFPNNILWNYNSEDQRRLRHLPDMWVRPGGKAFGSAFTTAPISPLDEITAHVDGMELKLEMVNRVIPIGAPARLNATLVNNSGMPQPGPSSLSLKSGFVSGKVIDPAGMERTFKPLVLCMDEDVLDLIDDGDSRSHAMTLLRGAQGALFPSPGLYTIVVDAKWETEGIPYKVSSQTQVMVTGAQDEAHANAAMDILCTPDALLSLVLNGDHLTEGNAAIQSALSNPVLRPHYAYIEAKRLMQRQGDRKPDLKAAAQLLEEETIMNASEVKKAAKLVQAASDKAPKTAVQKLQKCLKQQATVTGVSDETKEMIAAL
ncbi:MAG: hypothetical protein R3A44_43240 [Caldilineaceae bacterium]